MTTDLDEIRDRAWIERRRPPNADLDEPMWVAEDPVTGCAEAGRVEAEAVGNLVSVVECEYSGESNRPLMKLPGRVVSRPVRPADGANSVFARLRSLF